MIRNIDNFRHYQAKFESWLLKKEYSRRSVKSYLFDLSNYLATQAKATVLYEETRDLFSSGAIQSFVRLSHAVGNSESTVQRRLAGLQLFLDMLIEEKMMTANPIKEMDPRLRGDDRQGREDDMGRAFCHSRSSRESKLKKWIPAFAGMTQGRGKPAFAGKTDRDARMTWGAHSVIPDLVGNPDQKDGTDGIEQLKTFKAYLLKEGMSSSTTADYAADVAEFLHIISSP